MAAIKISNLTAKTTPVSADSFVIVDSAAGDNKKLSYGDLLGVISSVSSQLIVETNGNITTPQVAIKGLGISDDVAILFDGTINDFTIGIDDSTGGSFVISDNAILGTNNRLVIDTAGDVGIGTNISTLYRLDVNHDSCGPTPVMRLSAQGLTDDVGLLFDGSANDFTIGINDSLGGHFVIADGLSLSTNQRFVIDSDGDIGMPSRHHYSITYTAASITTSSEITLFNIASFGGSTIVNSSNGITLSTSTGRFTVQNTGIYKIEVTAYLDSSTTLASDAFRILKNGVQIYDSQPNVHSSVDPVERTISIIEPMTAGQFIEVRYDANGANTGTIHPGTTVNIYRFA